MSRARVGWGCNDGAHLCPHRLELCLHHLIAQLTKLLSLLYPLSLIHI